jgi:hypothetical protein
MANTAATTTPYANYTVPTFIGWGTANGSNATSVVSPGTAPSSTVGTGQWSDVGPFSEAPESRVLGSVSIIGNTAAANTVTTQITGTITCTQGGGESIGESFLAFSSTKPYSATITGTLPTGNTSMTVGTAWPAVSTPFYLQNNNEVIEVQNTSSTLIANTIVRAQNGSTACAGASGQVVTLGNIPGAGTANPHNADMFAHAGFVALALNNGDSIAFTWQIGVTS